MKRLVLGLILVSSGSAQTGNRNADLIGARAVELSHLATLYGIDLKKGGWHLEQVDFCPQFTRHAFATLQRTDGLGVKTSFTVIYSPSGPTAKSQKGLSTDGVVLLRTRGMGDFTHREVAEQDSTVNVFNKIWADELSHSGPSSLSQSIDSGGVARCYARIVGQEPLSSPDSAEIPQTAIRLKSDRIDGIVLGTRDSWSRVGTLSLEFDSKGMVRKGGVYSRHAFPSK